MSLQTGTKFRILATLLLLTASALPGMTRPIPAKNIGCTRADSAHGTPGSDGCERGGDGCYDCEYSGDDGDMQCFESPDGQTYYCTINHHQPYYN